MNKGTKPHSSRFRRFFSNLPNLNLFIVVYLVAVGLVYFGFIFLPEKIFDIHINIPTCSYILFSASSILLTTWGERISFWVKKTLFRNFIEDEEVRLVDQRKIRFLLIFVYFVAIVIFTLAALLDMKIFDIDKMDYSIIQSFATYIAYDRMVRNYSTILDKK